MKWCSFFQGCLFSIIFTTLVNRIIALPYFALFNYLVLNIAIEPPDTVIIQKRKIMQGVINKAWSYLLFSFDKVSKGNREGETEGKGAL